MWEVNPCEDTGWEYVSRSWLELTLPPWMFANPRFTGSLWPEVSGTAVWAGGRTYRFPSHQEGLPSAASALQFGQKGSFPQGDGCFSVPAADYLKPLRVSPLDRLLDQWAQCQPGIRPRSVQTPLLWASVSSRNMDWAVWAPVSSNNKSKFCIYLPASMHFFLYFIMWFRQPGDLNGRFDVLEKGISAPLPCQQVHTTQAYHTCNKLLEHSRWEVR